MRDRVAEMLSMLEGFRDDNAQFSAEVDEILEEHPYHPCRVDVVDMQAFLSDRLTYYEEAITQLLAGAPVLLGH